MLTIKDPLQAKPTVIARPSAVTIGNFDGCHTGHRALITAAVHHAEAFEANAIAFSFSPRPEAFFRGAGCEELLFTEEQKARAFRELGLDCHVLQTFDEAFSHTTHQEFYTTVLKERLKAKAIIVGENFRFGHGRHGDTAYLREQGQSDGIIVDVLSPTRHAGSIISSTRIRASLKSGDLAAATAMLGRPYLIEGVIRRGDQLGRKLGVPTANLEHVMQLTPRYGIYAGYVFLSSAADPHSMLRPRVMELDAAAIPAVFSIGVRPTLAQIEAPVRIEAHLLTGTYDSDALYGLQAGYYLSHWLRGEEQFCDLEALKAQMQKDISQARALTVSS